jgi:hypothetical protein
MEALSFRTEFLQRSSQYIIPAPRLYSLYFSRSRRSGKKSQSLKNKALSYALQQKANRHDKKPRKEHTLFHTTHAAPV